MLNWSLNLGWKQINWWIQAINSPFNENDNSNSYSNWNIQINYIAPGINGNGWHNVLFRWNLPYRIVQYCIIYIYHIFLFQDKNDLIAFNIISLLRFNTYIILSVFITEWTMNNHNVDMKVIIHNITLS